jgi:hypothetical protein
MDPNTAFFIVSSPRGRMHKATRQVSPYFDSLHHAVRALSFLRERLPRNESLHIEQGDGAPESDA